MAKPGKNHPAHPSHPNYKEFLGLLRDTAATSRLASMAKAGKIKENKLKPKTKWYERDNN